MLTTATMVTIVGKDVAIKSVSAAVSGVIRGASYLLGSSSKSAGVIEIKDVLITHDVTNQMKIFQALTKELETRTLNEALRISLDGVDEVLTQISVEIACINNKIEDAEKPYLYFWTKGGVFNDNVKRIQFLMERFQKRVQIFMDLLKIRFGEK